MKEKLINYLQQNILRNSISSTIKQSNRHNLFIELEKIVPDISDQYSSMTILSGDHFTTTKLRAQHTFQISLCLKALDLIDKEEIHITDIGDSSGNHLRYLNEVNKTNKKKITSLSVNLDPEAVKKIQNNGLDALLCRAEKLEANSGIISDIFLSFEMLEHLFDPISFLREMSQVSGNPIFAITVPYVKKSRVGLHYIRKNLPGSWNPENTHIFELCPYDWELLFNFAGWEVIYNETYMQFPKLPNPLFFTKPIWRRIDFEGFQGFILRKNSKFKKRYESFSDDKDVLKNS